MSKSLAEIVYEIVRWLDVAVQAAEKENTMIDWSKPIEFPAGPLLLKCESVYEYPNGSRVVIVGVGTRDEKAYTFDKYGVAEGERLSGQLRNVVEEKELTGFVGLYGDDEDLALTTVDADGFGNVYIDADKMSEEGESGYTLKAIIDLAHYPKDKIKWV